MGLKAVAGTSAAQVLSAVTPAGAIPRALLSRIQAIAQPACVLSARAAFADTGRSTPAVDGGTVGGLEDISGNGYVGSQSTSGNQPLWRARGINNNLPALDFSSSLSCIMPVSGVFAASGFSAGYTAYIVATSTGAETTTQTLDDLVSFTNHDNFGVFNGGVGLGGSFNGNGTEVSVETGDGMDYSGVYVTSYDGATGTIGLNGRYKSQAVAGTPPESGNLYIGGNAQYGTGSWSTGLIGEVWLFQGKHTGAQMDAIGALLAADCGLLAPCFLFVGDSISNGYGTGAPSVVCWPYQMCRALGNNRLDNTGSSSVYTPFPPNVFYRNRAITGETAATMIIDVASTPWATTGYVSPVRGNQNMAFIFAGTNDMALVSAGGLALPAAQAFANLQTLCALYRSANCKVAVGTAIARGVGTGGSGFEAQREIFNNLIYAAGGSLYDILIDFGGAASVFGNAANVSNASYYQSDQTHPTEQGHAYLAQIAEEAVGAYYSGNVLAPMPSTPQVVTKILKGATAGNMSWSMPSQSGAYKKFVAYFNGYENDTATNQTLTFPTPFINAPVITANGSGLTLAASATTLTITAPDSTTTYSGNVIVEGF